MEHLGLAAVGNFQAHVVVGTGLDVLHVLHIIVDTLQNVIAGRAHGHQVLPLLLGCIQSPDGGELTGDLVAAQGVNTAAALPILQLLELEAQGLGTGSGVSVQILGLVAQCTAGIIAVDHRYTFLKFPNS